MHTGKLLLADGTSVMGEPFGAPVSSAGEVVFNTGMVGYPEAMTDPSYRGQILVLTYPLVGNYGVPLAVAASGTQDGTDGAHPLESDHIQVKGLIISDLAREYSHCSALASLDAWMKHGGIPGLRGVDTRALTKRLRSQGSMLGRLIVNDDDIPWDDPNRRNLVEEISLRCPRTYPGDGRKKVVLVDLGCKQSILRCLRSRGLDVLRVPWNHDWSAEEADGVVLSNGPGDPKMCGEALPAIRSALGRNTPMLGICLGHQLLALAAGGDTFKLKYGHRGQNQPCLEAGSRRCHITSQNHGFAVEPESLSSEWQPWFFNANDGTNEGMRHRERPILSVQFHPEANPGPVDTDFIFDRFVALLDRP